MVEHADSATSGPTVMIVDDICDTRDMLRIMLKAKGYQVLEAPNGGEAVRIAARVRPNLILMDLDLPVLDGCAATRLIHARPELRRVPVVAMSAHSEWGWREDAIAAGCTAFVVKPIDLPQLVELVEQLMN